MYNSYLYVPLHMIVPVRPFLMLPLYAVPETPQDVRKRKKERKKERKTP